LLGPFFLYFGTHLEKTQVIAAVIEWNGKFLLGKRSTTKKSAPGYWCPVSGRIEDGETEQEAVTREVMEEVGLSVTPVEKLCDFDTRDGSARIHWWLMRILAGEATLKNDEHTELTWVTVDEMASLQPIFEEDVSVFKRVGSR
jgi:8-oxo-dGTP diphosphatase